MKNFNKSGENITLVAPSGGVVGGALYVVGDLAGIVHGSAAEGDSFVLELEGIYTVPKKSADALTVGLKVYYDTDLEAVTTSVDDGGDPAVDFVYVGKAVSVAAGSTTSVSVRLG